MQSFLSVWYRSVYIGKIHTHIRMCWLKICEPSSTQFFLGNINNKLCAVCFYRRKMFIQKLKIINTFSPARRTKSKKNLRTFSQGSRESVATVLDPLSKTSRMRDFYSTYSPALQAPSIIRYWKRRRLPPRKLWLSSLLYPVFRLTKWLRNQCLHVDAREKMSLFMNIQNHTVNLKSILRKL